MISFVVLHYLVSDETIKTVNSILQFASESNIVIVDNCSPNNSFEVLTEEYRNEFRVKVLRNDSNAGYAQGINFGYQFAKSNYNPDFIVAMNNDMEITQTNFSTLVYRAYKKYHFHILGPDIYSTATGKHQNPEKQSFRKLEDVEKEIEYIQELKKRQTSLSIKSFLKSIAVIDKLYYHFKKILKPTPFIENDIEQAMLHGSFYIFSKEFIKTREYALYPKTNFYCEAQILDYEAERDGLKRVYYPAIKILHHEDKATNAVAGSHASKMNKKYERLLESLNVFKELIESDLLRS
ncbi:TPA: glycosyltransferase family 2 protein [Streptococcus suis]